MIAYLIDFITAIRHRLSFRAQAKDFLKAFRKQRVYNADLLPPARLQEATAFEEELASALRHGETEKLEPLLEKGDRIAAVAFPSRPGDIFRENIEVFFVAFAAALALRAYFLQPFKIPTASMEPTLSGIETVSTPAPIPALPLRIYERFAHGRTWGSVQFDHPVTLVGLDGGSFTPYFEYTDLVFQTANDTIEKRRIWIGQQQAEQRLGLRPDESFEANQPVVHYVNDAGDQVLVDKFSYNFRLPKRGEVFVFRTNGIDGIEQDLRRRGVDTSEFYIKRCVGLPGDLLRIVPPLLEVNGSADNGNAGMKRVETARNGYHGYTILSPTGQHYLRTPDETHRVDPGSFWAMGDNSNNSLDSRFWGSVPRVNLIGTGFVVYWPFGPRWGLIR